MPSTSINLPSGLKGRLEYEARKNCRSVSAEIVFRLRQSMVPDVKADLEKLKVLVSGPRGD
jgi:hypothetical protein